ncbi:hypothetical protein BH23DEI1_BH23DEI1_24020 [soil metagenome]
MRVERGVVLRLAAHLARIEGSARVAGVPLDLEEARGAIAAEVLEAPDAPVLRLRLDHDDDGAVRASARPFDDDTQLPLVVVLASVLIDADHPRQRHKTTDRALYDGASVWARGAGVADVLFRNYRGALAEGAISTLFVRDGRRLRTPPIGDGALPGVLRGELLEVGAAIEASLDVGDLARGVVLGSALRGLREVTVDPTRSWLPGR